MRWKVLHIKKIEELTEVVTLEFDKLDREKNYNLFKSIKEFVAGSGLA